METSVNANTNKQNRRLRNKETRRRKSGKEEEREAVGMETLVIIMGQGEGVLLANLLWIILVLITQLLWGLEKEE